jgi:RNA polymerase primary sigma factor
MMKRHGPQTGGLGSSLIGGIAGESISAAPRARSLSSEGTPGPEESFRSEADTETFQIPDDPGTIRPGTRLRHWQREAFQAWQRHDHTGVVQAVTGTGKTMVGVVAISSALRAGMRCVVLVPTDQLVRQWTRTLHRLLPNAVVVEKAEEQDLWDVRVSTVQTAMRHQFLSRREGAMLVADECHRYGAPSYSTALRKQYIWRMGLSATAEREDDGDQILRAFFGEICFDLGYQRAVGDHLIAPYDIALVGVPLEATERAEYQTLTEDMNRQANQLVDLAEVPREPFSAFMAEASELAKEWRSSWQGLARSYLAKFARRRELLAGSEMKRRALAVLTPVARRSQGSLVFTQTRRSAEESAQMLSDAGIYAGAIHSGQSLDERDDRMFEFAAGQTRALAAPRVLDEGVDVPDADLGIVLASNRSRRQMIQRMGRVLRVKKDGGPARFVVMYAIDTVEDPHHRGELPPFFKECLPWARQWEEFDLGMEGESARLLRFLGVEEDAPDWEEQRSRLVGESSKAPEHGAVGGAGRPGRSENSGGPERPTEATATVPDDGRVRDRRPSRDGASPQPVGEHNELIVSIPAPEGSEGWTLNSRDDDVEEILTCGGLTTDPVRDYLKRIGRFPLLDAPEEVRLSRRIECGVYAAHLMAEGSWEASATEAELELLADQGRHAFEQMVMANLRLVVSLTKRFSGRGVAFLDLIQEGNIGLMHAVEMFDHAKGNKFSTYATWWIKQAVTRAMADQGSTIRIPVHFVEKMNSTRRWLRGRGLDWSDCAATYRDGIPELEVSSEELRRMTRLARPLVSIESLYELVSDSVPMRPVHGHGPVIPGTGLDPDAPFAWRAMEQLQDEEPRTARILMIRFGYETGQQETLDAVGAVFSLTRERIRQIERQGVERLREIVRDGARSQQLPENRPTRLVPAPRQGGKKTARTRGSARRTPRAPTKVSSSR